MLVYYVYSFYTYPLALILLAQIVLQVMTQLSYRSTHFRHILHRSKTSDVDILKLIFIIFQRK